MRRVDMASAAQQQLVRADALLSEELARLHAARSAMSPATKATACTVLRALAQDPDLDSDIGAEVRRVLEALLERPAFQPIHQHFGLRTIRLRAA